MANCLQEVHELTFIEVAHHTVDENTVVLMCQFGELEVLNFDTNSLGKILTGNLLGLFERVCLLLKKCNVLEMLLQDGNIATRATTSVQGMSLVWNLGEQSTAIVSIISLRQVEVVIVFDEILRLLA